MTLKTYRAFSMAEALAAVKRDLGRDAVILHTRSYRKGGLLGFGGRQMWEITASRNINVQARKAARPGGEGRLAEPAVSVIDGPAHLSLADGPAAGVSLEEPPSRLVQQVVALTSMVETLLRRQQTPDAPDMPQELFECYLDLVQQEVAEDLAKELVLKIRMQLTGEQLKDKNLIRQRLMEFIASMIPVAACPAGVPRAGRR